jgi:hypothetical protein
MDTFLFRYLPGTNGNQHPPNTSLSLLKSLIEAMIKYLNFDLAPNLLLN